MAVGACAQTFTTLVNFNGPNGLFPSYEMSLTQGRDGNLYGTAYSGGVNNYGTFFKMTPQGTLTVLYSFDYTAAYPVSGVVLGTDGNFYGTTIEGGAYGWGSVFKITPSGAFTILHSFNVTDGCVPYGTPVEGADGNFYGTTEYGGATTSSSFCYQGAGTVYKMTPAGALTTLHSFEGYQDGGMPWAGLTQAIAGNFYGTTYGGGTGGWGTVFQITPAGTLKTLHNFDSTDGAELSGTLIQAIDGDLYGTTEGGGVNGGGTVFDINAKGTLTTLHSFCYPTVCADTNGQDPVAGVIQASDGNFYGTTYGGGVSGTVYEVSPIGVLTVLYDLDIYSVGGEPLGGLFQATDGILYGTTSYGGAGGGGSIFSLDVGLGPFVAFVRRTGKVGQSGGILGQGFIGTTAVAINGIPANFKVVSDTYLMATVPAGATTGYVTVTTPSGVLTSNVPFQVIP